jgi:hypothetical protein
MRVTFPGHSNYQVVALGGCGRVGEEFVKPLLVEFKTRVFLLLDSDRPSKDELLSHDIRRLVAWLEEKGIQHYALQRRELENYLNCEKIAEVAKVNASVLRAPPGHEAWHDIKAAFARYKGFRYDERRLSVGAFDLLDAPEQRKLFAEETGKVTEMLASFLGVEKGTAAEVGCSAGSTGEPVA